ncbi:uncharacterized protein [Linepithema humile]|uniref:uncharacterized protein n=1 Tax=Linepithema humile TaxID=83485 RepID=UPI000623210B|nr:PREDICTED: uncharacterized protein LOC105670348 [Linepithema humile]XP_012219250.1 PREDICTED: uncharacterized protein LOC105670348 [Linepithema humile]XP_012219251.1 PREDICTED: uncharacterized protein LOC105670348 [Linepithema humile]
MEQNTSEVNLLNQEKNMKKEESWFLDTNHQQQSQNPIFYYKCDNNMVLTDDINELSTNTKWWKDVSSDNIRLTSESEKIFVETYSLIEHTTDSQSSDISQDPFSVNSEDSEKSLIKFKQGKKAKSLRKHQESIKRTKHPENWKVNVKKNARLKGEEYIGVGGKIVAAKKMGRPCVCRMQCTNKIDEKEREELHKVFWKTYTWQQRKQYIALSVKESPKQRTRLRNVQSEHSSRRRQVTFTYSLMLKGKFITVCKSMFLSTFAVSEKFVRHVMEKKRISPGGIIGPDQRGRHTPKTKKSEDVKDRVREHIKSFPTEKSTDLKDCSGRQYLDSSLSIAAMHKSYVLKCKQEGVSENDIVKESYYREMFKTEFNLGFKRVQSKEKKLLSNIDIVELNIDMSRQIVQE